MEKTRVTWEGDESEHKLMKKELKRMQKKIFWFNQSIWGYINLERNKGL
jgi:hypothetical protein